MAFLVLFIGASVGVGLTFLRIKVPGRKEKANIYQYVSIKYKSRKWRRR